MPRICPECQGAMEVHGCPECLATGIDPVERDDPMPAECYFCSGAGDCNYCPNCDQWYELAHNDLEDRRL